MTPTPLADLLAVVPGLDDAAVPVSFRAKGDTIVARWNLPRAASLYPLLDLGTLDRRYAVTVALDGRRHRFTLTRSEPGSADPAAPTSDDRFDPSRITEPLLAFLAAHGWTPRRRGPIRRALERRGRRG